MSGMNTGSARGLLPGCRKLAVSCSQYLLMSGFALLLGMAVAPAVYSQSAGGEQTASIVSINEMNTLPLAGLPPIIDLDKKLDALSQASGLDPATAKALRSIDGKRALWQAIVEHTRAQRSAMLGQTLAGYSSLARSAPSEWHNSAAAMAGIYHPLIRYAGGIQHDVKTLERELERIARSLRTDSDLDRRLHKVLERPGAAEAVYVDFVYPVYLATDRTAALEEIIERNAQGKSVIRKQAGVRAKAMIGRLEPLLAAVEQITGEVTRDAARIVDADPLHRAFKEALSDPLTTAITAVLRLRREPNMTAERLRSSVSEQLSGKFSQSGQGMVLSDSVDRRKAEANLALLYRLRAIARSNASWIRALLGDLDTRDGLHKAFKATLFTDFAAASLISDDAFKPVSDIFYKSSIFGSSLTQEGRDGWKVNPHRLREMALAVDHLNRQLQDYEEHREALRSVVTAAQLGAGARVAEFAVLQMAFVEALRDSDRLVDRWIDEYFDRDGTRYRVRNGKAAALAEIAGKQPVSRSRSISMDSVPTLSIQTRSDAYSNRHTHLLRSSAYVYLGSKFARDVYFNEFENHYAVRLWGIFDWNAQEAKDPEAFRKSLSKQASFLHQIANTHEKVIIYVFHTPKWLSASSDQRQVDGRPAYLLHSPKDYAAWRRFVRDTVRFLKQHLTGVDLYYEFWNEPEIYWPEGTDEFLRLYAETVTAIKEEHPEAKVGGATVNGWDGKVKGARGGDALNLELIRYAVAQRLPLDFIAWHHFERPLSDLEVAKRAYVAELRKLGVKSTPEFVISEWSIPGRGTQFEAAAFAEYMLALYRSGVDIQTVSAWDEFSVRPRPGHLAPWGMLTHQGFKKPMFHVHTYFDRLSRNSEGIAVFESDDKRTKVVASRKRDGSYELVVWESRYAPSLEAAIKTLREKGVAAPDLKQYGSIDQLERAIQDGKALKRGHSAAFRSASEVYRDSRGRDGDSSVQLRFTGASRLRVTASEAVGVRPAGRQVFTSGPNLVLNLPRSEVMWIRLEVD